MTLLRGRWYGTPVPRPHGKVSISALLFIAAIAGVVYWVMNYSSIYLDHMEVRDAVRGGIEGFGRRKSLGEVRLGIILKVNGPTCGEHKEDDGYGKITTIKGLGLKDENIIIERDDVQRTVRIAIDYDREITLRPQGKQKIVHFHYEATGPSPD